MKSFRIISRFVVVTAIAFVGNICAVDSLKDASSLLKHNKYSIGSTFLADRLADKNEHFKKAFIETTGRSLDHSTMTHDQFAQNLGINYGIRWSSEQLNQQGISLDTLAKKVDVLPEGSIKDIVNPLARSAAEFVTHPAFLTWIVMQLIAKYSDNENV